MKLNCNFQRGGVLGKIHSVEGVWIFSGTTQWHDWIKNAFPWILHGP